MSGVSILVTSHACFRENLRLTLGNGMFSIDVHLLKNIALEDADLRFDSLTGWLCNLSTNS